MSRDAKATLTWGDGEYVFRLPIGQLEELQEKCDAGPPLIYQRLSSQTWHVHDVRETIRLGLIGGGLKPPQALKLVKRYVDEQPLIDNVLIARAVLHASLFGVEDEQPGKSEAAEPEGDSPNHSLEGNGVSPPSMGQQA